MDSKIQYRVIEAAQVITCSKLEDVSAEQDGSLEKPIVKIFENPEFVQLLNDDWRVAEIFRYELGHLSALIIIAVLKKFPPPAPHWWQFWKK